MLRAIVAVSLAASATSTAAAPLLQMGQFWEKSRRCQRSTYPESATHVFENRNRVIYLRSTQLESAGSLERKTKLPKVAKEKKLFAPGTLLRCGSLNNVGEGKLSRSGQIKFAGGVWGQLIGQLESLSDGNHLQGALMEPLVLMVVTKSVDS